MVIQALLLNLAKGGDRAGAALLNPTNHQENRMPQ